MNLIISERDNSIDIAKGIAINLMVIGHLGFYLKTGSMFIDMQKLIYIFHMPFFFLVSGYNLRFSSEYSLQNLIVKRIRGLIVPWAAWCTITSVLPFILFAIISHNKINIVLLLKRWIFPIITTGNFNGGWYIPCLFWSQILAAAIIIHIKGREMLIAILVLFGILGMFIPHLLPPELFFYIHNIHRLDIALVAGMFIGIGYTAKMMNFEIASVAVISSFLVAASFFFNSFIDMNNSLYGNKLLFISGALAGSYLLLFTSKKLEKHKSKTGNLLSIIGKNSMWILLTHGFILTVFNILLNINSKTEVNYLVFILYTVLPGFIVLLAALYIRIIRKVTTKTFVRVDNYNNQ